MHQTSSPAPLSCLSQRPWRHAARAAVALLAPLLMAACSQEPELSLETAGLDQDDDHTTATIDDSYRYQLPVVFHVMYQDESDTAQYIPAARLGEILRNVNDLWSGRYYGKSEDMGVDFVLALDDEQGRRLAQPGVDYVRYTGAWPINPREFMKAKSSLQYEWEPNEYINVMVFPFKGNDEGASTTLGISHMPMLAKGDTALLGLEQANRLHVAKNRLRHAPCVTINSAVLGGKATMYSESTRYTDPDHGRKGYLYTVTDVCVTLAHELGHYLGLHHVFTEQKTDDGYEPVDDCNDTDYCDDTKSYNYRYYQSWLSDKLNALAEARKEHPDSAYTVSELALREACDDAQEFTSTNFMDYSYGFSFAFTPDQRRRVRHVLTHSPLIPGPKVNGANESEATIAATQGAATRRAPARRDDDDDDDYLPITIVE